MDDAPGRGERSDVVSDPEAPFQMLAAVIEHVPVGIIVVDGMGRLVLMNDVGRQISGAVPEESDAVADQSDAYALREPETGRPLDPEETPIARAVAGEVVKNFEYVFRPPGARTDSRVRVVAAPLHDAQGGSMGAVAVFEDVTEERRRERAREDFLTAAAHDLKSPLTVIKGVSQILDRRLAKKEVLRRDDAAPHLQRITRTVDRMENQIAELLDIARSQAGEHVNLTRGRVDLAALARRVAQEQAETSDSHVIEIDTVENGMTGDWDAQRLERVIRNLISNAVAYSPDGGTVAVVVRRETLEGRTWAVVRVRDQGIGIPGPEISRIFDHFYRGSNVVERFAGSGIGLASVKHIVEQHGGRVEVESCEGIGSTFSIRLPLDPASPTL